MRHLVKDTLPTYVQYILNNLWALTIFFSTAAFQSYSNWSEHTTIYNTTKEVSRTSQAVKDNCLQTEVRHITSRNMLQYICLFAVTLQLYPFLLSVRKPVSAVCKYVYPYHNQMRYRLKVVASLYVHTHQHELTLNIIYVNYVCLDIIKLWTDCGQNLNEPL